jgi:cobalt-zinc-cadmium efflux system membrane fusion protein
MANSPFSKAAIAGGVVVLVAVVVGLVAWKSDRQGDNPADAKVMAEPVVRPTLVQLATDRPNTIRITDEGMKLLGIQTVEARPSPPPEPLRLPGSIGLDPNKLVRIHSRFPGELARIGTITEIAAGADNKVRPRARPLRYGDKVKVGQVLAVVWSKDIGEKKSEMIDAICKRDADRVKLSRYKSVPKGVIPESTILAAEHDVQSDEIAFDKAERTLLSWKVTPDELAAVFQEAKDIQSGKPLDKNVAKSWAETEIRSPIEGTIVEKNFNVGDILGDVQADLFKIADMSRVVVMANAFEEDLPILRALRPEQRNWKVDIKADPNDIPIPGKIDLIGSIVDQTHSAAIMGSLDNSDGRLNIGQFITATIDLPPDPTMVAVPTSALVEEGDNTQIFVEVDSVHHEFARRQVMVTRRGRNLAFVRVSPTSSERREGDEPLHAGEHVITTGVLELAAQLDDMKGDALVQSQAKQD